MIDLSEPMAWVVEELTLAGVAAVLNAEDVAFPGVIVSPVEFDLTSLSADAFESVAELVFVTGTLSTSDALAALSAMVNLAATRFVFETPLQAANVQLAALGGASPSPALIARVRVFTKSDPA